MPNHSCAAISKLSPSGTSRMPHAARADRFFYRGVYGVELMITCKDFMQITTIRIFFENDEVLEQIEKPLAIKYSAYEHI